MPKFQWKGDNKLCIPTLEGGKVMPGAVFEMDADSQKLAGVQKYIGDGLIVPYPETSAPTPVSQPPEIQPEATKTLEVPASAPEGAPEAEKGPEPTPTPGLEGSASAEATAPQETGATVEKEPVIPGKPKNRITKPGRR